MTAALRSLPATPAVNDGMDANGKDSSTIQVLPHARQHGTPSLHSPGMVKSPLVCTCTSVCTERQHEPKREKPPDLHEPRELHCAQVVGKKLLFSVLAILFSINAVQ